MKRLGCILALIFIAVPAWPAKKITVGELTDMLKSMSEQKKGDLEVANALKQVQLSEELTRSAMNSLANYAPGPLTTEQIYVLEASSAVLAPPATDIPSTPAPDAAAQKALLDKANDYAAKTYAQLPAMSATKTTVRFQDNVEAPGSNSGMQGGAKEITTGSGFTDLFIDQVHKVKTKLEGVFAAQPGKRCLRNWHPRLARGPLSVCPLPNSL